MTRNLTRKQIELMQHIQNGGSSDGYTPKLINGLIKAGLVYNTPSGLNLSTAGWEALAALRKYVIEQWHFGAWVAIPNAAFETLQDAEVSASRRSLTDTDTGFRVIVKGEKPAYFPVFIFGKRYVQDSTTGARFSASIEVNEDPVDEIAPLYEVQRRGDPVQNGGQVAPWETVTGQPIVELDIAQQTAGDMAGGDPDGQYRVAYANAPDLPPVVFQGDSVYPDVGVVDVLAQVGAGAIDSAEPLPRKKRRALGRLVADWTLRDRTAIVDVCAGAAEHDVDLSQRVAELRGSS